MMSCPRFVRQGTADKQRQGTSLLYIAGEKTRAPALRGIYVIHRSGGGFSFHGDSDTFLKILEQKGFVERRKGSTGKLHFFMPLMTRERYRRQVMDDVKQTFFGGSVASLVSFFAEEDELSPQDISEILSILQSRQQKTTN